MNTLGKVLIWMEAIAALLLYSVAILVGVFCLGAITTGGVKVFNEWLDERMKTRSLDGKNAPSESRRGSSPIISSAS